MPSNVDPAIALAQMIADDLYERMTGDGESFWTIVCAPFMARDITRETVRAIVRRGLECTRGNYRLLAPLFNFPVTDYKRFLNFLDKHDCHVAVPALPAHQPRHLERRRPRPAPKSADRSPAAQRAEGVRLFVC